MADRKCLDSGGPVNTDHDGAAAGGTVFVKLPCGKSITADWRPRELVSDLRTRVVLKSASLSAFTTKYHHSNFVKLKPPCPSWTRDCYLRLGAKPMREDVAIGEYLRSGDRHANAFLIPRRRGGCFIISFSVVCILFLATVMSVCTCGLSLLVVPFLVPWLFILPWIFL